MDSGSTYNFLDPLVIKATKLKVEKGASLQVKVANGDIVLSQGQCEETIKIQGSKFRIPFHVLSFEGCDVVPGVQWLRTLGPITWDFSTTAMSFKVGQSEVVLQGLKAVDLELKNGEGCLKSSLVNQHGWFL